MSTHEGQDPKRQQGPIVRPETKAKADRAATLENWRKALVPRETMDWLRRFAMVALGGAIIGGFLIQACRDRAKTHDSRGVSPTTQAPIAPETLLREAQTAAAHEARKRQMALRARALAEQRARHAARQRLERALAQSNRSQPTTPAPAQPVSRSRFRTLSPSTDAPTVGSGLRERARKATGREELRERLLAEAIERQALPASLPLAEAASGDSSVEPRNAPSYRPVHAEFHSPTGLVLRAGTSIPATLLTHISSEAHGPVQAIVNHPIYTSSTNSENPRGAVIPAGTRVFGFHEGQAGLGDRRLSIAWNRLQFADGRTLILERVATTDGQGTAGVEARVNNRWPSFYFHAFLTSITGATAQLSQRRGSRGDGQSTPGEDATAALGRNLSEVTRQVADRNLSRSPILEVQAGTRLAVTLTEDLILAMPRQHQELIRPASR